MLMIDTEGEYLPGNHPEDIDCWDINLWGDGDLLLSVPMCFEVVITAELYRSAGVIRADLRSILQEYLESCMGLDEGEGLRPLAAMFREFADLYEAEAKNKGLPL